MISRDSSVFMFCYALPVHHVHAFFSYCGTVACCFDVCKMPSCCFGQIVAMTCIVCVCVAPLLRFECALYETCLILHIASYYNVASLF